MVSRSLTFLLPGCLLLGCRVLFTFHRSGPLPEWFRFHSTRRFCFFSTSAGFLLSHRSDLVSFRRWPIRFCRAPRSLLSNSVFGRWRSVSSTSEEVLARFPSVVGPSPVLLPEGRFPGSVSARWFPSRSFSTKPFVATEVVPKNCYCYTSRQNTVIGNSTTEVMALPVPHFPKVM